MQLGFRVQWSACYFLCGKETKTVHHQSKSRALQLHPTPFKTWNFNFLLQLFWRRMISISTLHPTFHSFITAQQPWQSASNQSNHKVVFGALPYTSFWPISPRDCQQFLATIWQPVGEYKFSLVTSGYHGITDRSLGLCDWDLNLQSQDEEVNHLGVQSRSANSGGLIMMPPKWSVVGTSYWEATLAQSQQTLFRFELSAGCRIPRFPTRKPGNWDIWASLPTMAWTQVGSRKIMDGWIAGPKVIQYKLIRFAKLFSIVFEDKHRIAIELMRWPTVSGNSTAMSPAKVKRGQLPASKLPRKQCKMFNI